MTYDKWELPGPAQLDTLLKNDATVIPILLLRRKQKKVTRLSGSARFFSLLFSFVGWVSEKLIWLRFIVFFFIKNSP